MQLVLGLSAALSIFFTLGGAIFRRNIIVLTLNPELELLDVVERLTQYDRADSADGADSADVDPQDPHRYPTVDVND